jgi:N-acetyl-gamma-glutamyl-phosphate reductase
MIMHYYVNNIPVGVLGASGYAGRELCALIAQHSRFTLAFATANEQRGQTVRFGRHSVKFIASDDAVLDQAAIIFCALPHGASLPWVDRARASGARVVDLSSDMRPGNGPAAARAVYGMPELGASVREAIRLADIVANPGCYPTSILLALAPLVAAGLVAPGATIVANSASGVSGAGNSPKRELLFGEVTEDFRAYGVGNTHRHLKEMSATMTALGAADADLIFTPHLLPIARGILSTITVPMVSEVVDATETLRAMYANEPFIEVVTEQPRLADVARRNVVRMTATMIAGMRSPTMLVTSAIDNLVKGAAGQALQNANIMSGFAETEGLPA